MLLNFLDYSSSCIDDWHSTLCNPSRKRYMTQRKMVNIQKVSYELITIVKYFLILSFIIV
jgi:hypothetical protein